RRAAEAAGDLTGLEWAAEQVTLPEVASPAAQLVQLAGGLDALGHGHHAQRLRHLEDHPRERGAAVVVVAGHDRGRVDLDEMHRVALDVVERSHPRSEVVDGEPHTGAPETLERVAHA